MSTAYCDGTAVAAVLAPGATGERAATVWASFDAVCAHDVVEIEVPSLIGRSLHRMAWVMMLATVALTEFNESIRSRAIDLAWLGAPTLVAIHVATALEVAVDHYATTDPIAANWADVHGLNVVKLG